MASSNLMSAWRILGSIAAGLGLLAAVSSAVQVLLFFAVCSFWGNDLTPISPIQAFSANVYSAVGFLLSGSSLLCAFCSLSDEKADPKLKTLSWISIGGSSAFLQTFRYGFCLPYFALLPESVSLVISEAVIDRREWT
jgi:hypothetical protein